MPSLLPWPEMWRAAIRSGVPADQFWQLSLKEWRWLCAPVENGLAREELSALEQRYPDRQYKE